jgi:hypothetical protein
VLRSEITDLLPPRSVFASAFGMAALPRSVVSPPELDRHEGTSVGGQKEVSRSPTSVTDRHAVSRSPTNADVATPLRNQRTYPALDILRDEEFAEQLVLTKVCSTSVAPAPFALHVPPL